MNKTYFLGASNKLTHSVSTHQILETYPMEAFQKLGVEGNILERILHRVLERIGKSALAPIRMTKDKEIFVWVGEGIIKVTKNYQT